jgi:hypothetical protein
MAEPRRFPPPWTVEETAPCFIVRDANGQALAYAAGKTPPPPRCRNGWRGLIRSRRQLYSPILSVANSPAWSDGQRGGSVKVRSLG